MKAEPATANVSSLFFESAKKHPQRIAISSVRGEISYKTLVEEVFMYAGYLRTKGIGRGDRVLIFTPISIDLYKVVLAVMQVGAVAVFLDPWSDLKRLKASGRQAECTALISGRKLRWLSYLLPVFRDIPKKLSPNGKSKQAYSRVEQRKAHDPALITFTTGSSGEPKGANRTHGFLQEQLQALQKEVPPVENDRCLTNLPVFTLSHLAEGITSVIPDFNPRRPQKMKPEKLQRQMLVSGVKTLVLSPDILLRLSAGEAGNSSSVIKRIFTGGAPVFPDQAKQIARAFPLAKTVVAYGSTEVEPISSIPLREIIADDRLKKGGLPAGTIHPDCEVRIMKWIDEVVQPKGQDEFQNLQLKPGKLGEIIVCGPHVLPEYYKNPQAQIRQKFILDTRLWHRTGDSGFLDEDGKLYLTGPCKQLIKTADGYLSPFLMEYRLRQVPSVAEGTVVMNSGKKILFLKKQKGVSLKKVSQDILSAEIPFERMVFLKKLPKDPRHNSKIDYTKLLYSS